MIHENELISRRQYLSICFLSLLSPIIRQLPQICPHIAGTAGWLAGLAAAPVLLLFELLLSRLTKKCAEGEGMGEIFLRVYGKHVGSAVLLLYALWMVGYAGFVIIGGADRLLTAAYPRGGRNLFIIVMGVLGAVAVLGRVRTLARMANILRPLLLVALLLVIVSALPGAKLRALLPVTPRDILPTANAGVRTANVFLLIAAFRFLEDRVEKDAPGARMRAMLRLLGLLVVLSTLLLISVQANFGPEFSAHQAYPFFAMARNIRVFGSIERIDVLIIALWVFTDFVLIAALLLSAKTILRLVLHTDSRVPALVCAAAATFGALACSIADVDLELFAGTVFPISGAVIAFGLYPLTLLVGLLRKKI